MQIEYSPIAALNRTYALSLSVSKEVALVEALKIDLTQNHLYHALLAELYDDIDPQKHVDHLRKAFELAKKDGDREVIKRKLGRLE